MRRAAFFSLLLTTAGFAYVREVTSGATPVPLVRVDNTAIQFFLNNQIVPGMVSSASGSIVITSDSNPIAAVRQALATWNAVSTANINFLPLQQTTAVINPNDFQATIAVGSTDSDISAVGGALAVTVDFYVTSPSNLVNGKLLGCSSNCKYPPGGITDSDIILNPAFTFSTTGTAGSSDLQAVLTHELGHALSANHTGVLGGTMFPYVNGALPRYLSTDDLAFVSSAYPATAAPPSFGTISGKVASSSGAGISYGLITMIDATGGSTIGGLTNPDGTFAVLVPPGTYIIYAEPFNSYLSLGPGNFYLTAAQAALVSTFQSTMYGGAASPTQVVVSANGTATVNITVTAGTSPVQMQVYSFGAAGGAGGITNFSGVGGPIQLPSGASIDLVFAGPGLDKTLTDANLRIYGQGISVRSGTVRVDNSEILEGSTGPLIRVTLDIPARQTDTLASIFISTAAGTSSLSGILTVTPPTPLVTSQNVKSSASGLAGAVSPGGIYTIYGSAGSLGPTGGPLAGGFNNNGFDLYSSLPPNLAGVSVTFDGVPAPLFFVDGQVTGQNYGQINLQVPFEVAGKASTQVVVNYLGSSSAPVTVPVVPVQPALYVSCGGSVCAVNLSNNGINSAQNPAPAGSYVEVFGTGIGVLSYTFPTGQGAPAPPLAFQSTYTYSIGGSPTADAAFGGWAYDAAGEAQWNLLIPAGIGTGAVPIVVTDKVTGASSQTGAMIYVK